MTKFSGVSRGVALTTVSILALTATQAWAQAAAPTAQLGEVVVTAQKRSENLQQTAIAITALNNQALTAVGAQSILDLNTRIPNLWVGGAGAAGKQAGTFFIRGIGVDTDTLAKEPGVGLYIDDFYYGHTAGSLLSLLDVDSIEVLRGPQGTLFGKNTIGGAVRYNSVKPNFSRGGSFEVAGGSMEHYDFKVNYNMPLTSTLAARISLGAQNEGGYVNDIPLNKKLGDEHTNSARLQLRFQNDKWDVNATVDAIGSHNNGSPTHLDIYSPSATASGALYNKIVAGTAPVPFYSRALYTGISAPGNPAGVYDSRYIGGSYETYATNVGYKETGAGANLTAAYKMTDSITLKSLTGYRNNQVNYRNDNDQSPLNWNQNNVHEWLPSFSEELQILGKAFGGRLNYIGGLYYYKETPETIADRLFPGEPDGNQQYDNIKTTSQAVFGQFDFKITDQLKLTAGGRYSDDYKQAYVVRTKVLLNAAGLAGAPEAATATGFTATTATQFAPISGSGSKHFTNFSPKVALQMQWTPDIMTYASASSGYRAGNFNDGIAVFNPTTGANPNNGILPFNQETDWSYEVGGRTEFFDHRLRANISVFYQDYSNLQVSSSQVTAAGAASFIKIDNVAKARLQGGELSLLFKPTQDVTIGGDMGVLDAKYLQIASTVTAISLTSKLAGSPAQTYSLFGTYNPILSSGADILANISYGYQGQVATVTSAATQVVLPAYGLLNGSVFYNFQDRRTSVGITAKNMLNTRYLIGATSLVAVAAGNAGMQYSHIGRPAEVFATLKYKF